MEKDPRDVIIRPVITEHSYDQMEGNTFTFEVAKDANKVEIRQAIEAIFDVTVVKVNTLNVKPVSYTHLPGAHRWRAWTFRTCSRCSKPRKSTGMAAIRCRRVRSIFEKRWTFRHGFVTSVGFTCDNGCQEV